METWLSNMDLALWQKFALAALIGLDAVTLSTAQLAGKGVSCGVAAQALLLAVTANTLAKASPTLFLGAGSLRRYTLPSLGFLPLVRLGWASLTYSFALACLPSWATCWLGSRSSRSTAATNRVCRI